ncbi:MAG: flagellar hook capping protein [Lachnospiraceae bacterium]|nr:flagellar hook capping protein [Lachnospiraceae bacterium]
MADNISALIQDGKFVTQTASQISLSKESSKGASSLDKDAFLQLLVAQMKHQDPLEPTDNTEYISQLATFSELEEMQNMTAGMTFQRAGALVGQEVVCKTTNQVTGNTEYVSGIVDYVVYENNKAYLSINESLYSMDDVHQVIDPEYKAAYELGKKFASTIASLPGVQDLTLEYEDAISTLRSTYDGMNPYQKSFLSEDIVTLLGEYEAKIKELKLAGDA